jgi:tRNA 2-thiouridine synthesizing protein C
VSEYFNDLVFVQPYAPHGSIKGQEVLDACLMGSAFASCALFLMNDGVFQITKNQNPIELGLKDYSVSYGALADYGVERIYCRQSDLDSRGLTPEDLIVPIQLLADHEIRPMLAAAKQVLTF